MYTFVCKIYLAFSCFFPIHITSQCLQCDLTRKFASIGFPDIMLNGLCTMRLPQAFVFQQKLFGLQSVVPEIVNFYCQLGRM